MQSVEPDRGLAETGYGRNLAIRACAGAGGEDAECGRLPRRPPANPRPCWFSGRFASGRRMQQDRFDSVSNASPTGLAPGRRLRVGCAMAQSPLRDDAAERPS